MPEIRWLRRLWTRGYRAVGCNNDSRCKCTIIIVSSGWSMDGPTRMHWWQMRKKKKKKKTSDALNVQTCWRWDRGRGGGPGTKVVFMWFFSLFFYLFAFSHLSLDHHTIAIWARIGLLVYRMVAQKDPVNCHPLQVSRPARALSPARSARKVKDRDLSCGGGSSGII